MPRLSTTVAVLITAVLALLLIGYVFTFGGRRSDNAPHCASSEALDQIKAELFRRAGDVRGRQDPTFANIARYSIVRAPSRMVRRHHGESNEVTCSGSIAVDLPPGVIVAGNRRTLGSQLQYDLEPATNRTARLLTLSKADEIVIPLATLFPIGSQASQPLSAISPAAIPAPAQIYKAKPSAKRAVQPPLEKAPPPDVSPPSRKDLPKTPSPATVERPALQQPRAPPAPKIVTRPPASPAVSTSPSFNCGYARTRGEIAVCGNPALARLDRQMAGQFFRALSVARPGQRAMLQRSRNRFLRYRDSCSSESCIAEAYRGRIREISDIMAAGW